MSDLPLDADERERLGSIASHLEMLRTKEGMNPEQIDRDVRFLRGLARRVPEPTYPADLVDALAKALAAATLAALPSSQLVHPLEADGRQAAREALDRYTQEVGRHNVPSEVEIAIAELGG